MPYYIIGITLFMVLDCLFMYILERYYSKKCNYDCSKCKNWHCLYHVCERKRKKFDIKFNKLED